MNLKRIEKEIDKLADEMILTYEAQARNMQIVPITRDKWLYHTWTKHIVKLIRQVIKQVVESVPTENTLGTYYDFITEDKYREQGFNACVEQIKQWKKKILKEVKENDKSS